MSEWFSNTARLVSDHCGRAWVFCLAFLIIIVWAVCGPFANYSDTWQLIINTGTSVSTFLVVFIIQNTQNRDTKATQLKLDEIITALDNARNTMRGIEDLSEEHLRKIKQGIDGLDPPR